MMIMMIMMIMMSVMIVMNKIYYNIKKNIKCVGNDLVEYN